jgi:signal transduction histidine kinase
VIAKDALDDASAAAEVEELAGVGLAAVDALSAVQDERDVSGLFESDGTGAGALSEAREKTDTAIAALTDQLDKRRDADLGAAFDNATAAFDREMSRLEGYRAQRDSANPPFDQGGANSYHQVAETLQRLAVTSDSVSKDPLLARRISALGTLAEAIESASMERGTVAFFISPGAVPTPAQRNQAIILKGEQDLLSTGRFTNGFRFTDQARIYFHHNFVGRHAIATARSDVSNGVAARITKEQWFDATTSRLDGLRGVQQQAAQDVVTLASKAADSARRTSILSAGAVLVVLVLTVFLAIVVARSIIGPLRRLRASALETAQTHLPELVSRVHREGPTAAHNIPQAVTAEGSDEIGQVATAFNDVHSTAVRVAAEQALLRQNLDTIVVNLSRRTQSLVDRQLGEIEGLEQRERDPDQLSTLFRIDHMATRVRRHAESLLVLAGVDEMRKHSAAAGVLDVVRTAVGEVEQYPRVKFGVMPTDLVAAGAVDDIAHLLAELIDNATEFSAPATPVKVTSQPLLGGGLRLQVTDSGLGIPAAQLSELNERLRNIGDIDVAASRTLGLYVVARLAAKHGIQVRLEAVAEGGTAAQVDLPAHLILSPLDTSEGVLTAVTPDTETPPRPLSTVPPEPYSRAPEDSSPAAPVVNMAPEPSHWSTRETPFPDPIPEPALGPMDNGGHSSLPTEEPELAESDSPIFDSVASAWFSRSDTSHDWSSPADEGWRRAAEALRSAEEAASARRSQRDTEPIPDSRPQPGAAWAQRHVGRTAPQPTTSEEAAVSASGLPVRQRGASLVPGSISETTQAAQTPHPSILAKDASTVATTLSSLQRGVDRGRDETGGWVPKRPSDPERSNS